MDRLKLPAWVKDRTEDIQNSPAWTIFIVFTLIWGAEKIWPGTFYAMVSASLGAGVLYMFQMREDLWPAPLQRLLGTAVTSENDIATDEPDNGTEDRQDEDSSLFAREGGEAEDEDECYRLVDEEEWLSRGIDDNAMDGHEMQGDGQMFTMADLGACQDGPNANDMQQIGVDWLEMFGNQERNGRGGFRGIGNEIMAPEEERPDPVNKARLDLLFRYLASMDARNSEQGATPQRQKLQRKLLQRTAAGDLGATKAGKKAGATDTGSMAVDVADGTHTEENVLEDSVNIEALLQELEEPNETSHAKAQGPSKRARRKGSNSSLKRPQASVQKTVEPAAHEVTAPTAKKSMMANAEDVQQTQQSHAVSGKANIERQAHNRREKQRSPDSDSSAAHEVGIEEAVEADETEPVGFQVVANRKARRKSQKEDRAKADAEAKAEAVAKKIEAEAKAKAKIDEDFAAKNETEKVSNVGSDQARCQQSPTRDEQVHIENTATATTKADDGPLAEENEKNTTPPDPLSIASECACEGREDEAVEEEEWEEDDEAWEWQCPEGYLLQPYTCERPLACSSCNKMQPKDASVLRAEESGWLACEECIQIAWEQPVEPRDWEEDRVAIAEDPLQMSALEIATWFKERGAENELRQCMLQVLAAQNAQPQVEQQFYDEGEGQHCEESKTTPEQK